MNGSRSRYVAYWSESLLKNTQVLLICYIWCEVSVCCTWQEIEVLKRPFEPAGLRNHLAWNNETAHCLLAYFLLSYMLSLASCWKRPPRDRTQHWKLTWIKWATVFNRCYTNIRPAKKKKKKNKPKKITFPAELYKRQTHLANFLVSQSKCPCCSQHLSKHLIRGLCRIQVRCCTPRWRAPW